MKKTYLLLLCFLSGNALMANPPKKQFTLNLDGKETRLIQKNDKVQYDSDGNITMITGTTEPAVQVYLPDEKLNKGIGVIICAGGALRMHSWGNDVKSMAQWLNERGIAVIGLKYRLNTTPFSMPAPQKNDKGKNPFEGLRMALPITDFDQLKNANANPDPSGQPDKYCDQAIDDALRTVKLVRSRAKEWNLDPQKIGFLGYSAGGGVAIGATVRADAETMPSFLATCYGPSLIDVTVPQDAPPLFIATRVEHPNVAAGLLALYLEWKKAGANAEIYLYDDGRMGFGPNDEGSTSGLWRTNFLRWLMTR